MNIEILQNICALGLPLIAIHFGLKLAKRITKKALKKEDLEAAIYCRDMYRDIYKNYLDKMWNINRWLGNYNHSPKMIERALHRIECLQNAADNYKQLWESNEKVIEKHA